MADLSIEIANQNSNDDFFVLPDMTSYKADKHEDITLIKKQYFWQWLEFPQQRRTPKTLQDCAKRLGTTIQTLRRWKLGWTQYEKSQSLTALHTTPEEVTDILEKKLSELSPLLNTKLSADLNADPKRGFGDLTSYILWFTLTKGSAKLMRMIDTVDDAESLIKILEKITNIVEKIDHTGLKLIESGKSVLHAKKTLSLSAEFLAGCDMPRTSIKMPEDNTVEVIDVEPEKD